MIDDARFFGRERIFLAGSHLVARRSRLLERAAFFPPSVLRAKIGETVSLVGWGGVGASEVRDDARATPLTKITTAS